MQVVLKPSVIDEILKKLTDAERMNRKVDYIRVTPEEMDEIHHHVHGAFSWQYRGDKTDARYTTITLTDGRDPHGPKRTFASSYQLFGHPLYVVPNYFH